MAVTQTVTGKIRYRPQKRWLKDPVLVLQVEIHEHGFFIAFNGGNPGPEDVDRKFWRDAVFEDISFSLKGEEIDTL